MKIDKNVTVGEYSYNDLSGKGKSYFVSIHSTWPERDSEKLLETALKWDGVMDG